MIKDHRRGITRSAFCALSLKAFFLFASSCSRSAVSPGLYAGQFSWNHGLEDAYLAEKSEPHRTLDLLDTDIHEQVESLIRTQLRRANLRTAQGSITMEVLGTQPLLIALKKFEVQVPNLALLLKYVESEDVEEIQQFLSKYGNVNQQDLPSQRTALFYAAAGSKVVAVKALLMAGADPNLADFEGDTPLIAAVTSNCLDAARQLIASGANVDQANQNGETPLIRAIDLDRPAMVRLLLKNGANPNYVLPDGRSAVRLARKKSNQTALSLLQRYGAAN